MRHSSQQHGGAALAWAWGVTTANCAACSNKNNQSLLIFCLFAAFGVFGNCRATAVMSPTYKTVLAVCCRSLMHRDQVHGRLLIDASSGAHRLPLAVLLANFVKLSVFCLSNRAAIVAVTGAQRNTHMYIYIHTGVCNLLEFFPTVFVRTLGDLA